MDHPYTVILTRRVRIPVLALSCQLIAGKLIAEYPFKASQCPAIPLKDTSSNLSARLHSR
jgi:hypothetical protein